MAGGAWAVPCDKDPCVLVALEGLIFGELFAGLALQSQIVGLAHDNDLFWKSSLVFIWWMVGLKQADFLPQQQINSNTAMGLSNLGTSAITAYSC